MNPLSGPREVTEVFAKPIRQPVLYCKDCGHYCRMIDKCDYVYDPVWGKIEDRKEFMAGNKGTTLNNPRVFREDKVFIETCGPEAKFFIKRGLDQVVADNAVSSPKHVDVDGFELQVIEHRKREREILTSKPKYGLEGAVAEHRTTIIQKPQTEKPKRGWFARMFLKEPESVNT